MIFLACLEDDEWMKNLKKILGFSFLFTQGLLVEKKLVWLEFHILTFFRLILGFIELEFIVINNKSMKSSLFRD
jgi:thiol:disulfide interchange protein